MKLQIKQYKEKLLCSICGTNERNCILPCFHMFCSDCITKNIDSRQRQCPLDRKKIGRSDMKPIYWGGGDQI